jgi:hypothetical protein
MDIFKVLGEMGSVKSATGRAYTQATDTTTSMSLNGTCEQYFRVEIYHQSGKVTTQEFKDLNQAMQSYAHQLANYDKRSLKVYAVQSSGESLIVSHR